MSDPFNPDPSERVYADMTHAELEFAFNLVARQDDWRGPIDTYIRRADCPAASAAVWFFTATRLEVVPPLVRGADGIDMVRVRSVGYRAGPAGP